MAGLYQRRFHPGVDDQVPSAAAVAASRLAHPAGSAAPNACPPSRTTRAMSRWCWHRPSSSQHSRCSTSFRSATAGQQRRVHACMTDARTPRVARFCNKNGTATDILRSKANYWKMVIFLLFLGQIPPVRCDRAGSVNAATQRIPVSRPPCCATTCASTWKAASFCRPTWPSRAASTCGPSSRTLVRAGPLSCHIRRH